MNQTTLLDKQGVQVKLDAYLNQYFDRKIAAGKLYGEPYIRMVTRIKALTLRGGKRIRPYLSYLGYSVAGGPSEPPLEVLAALELFHNSLLMHDDFMDRDTQRHGGPNIAGIYLADSKHSDRHLADSAEILAGDLAIAYVYELVMSSGLPAAKMQAVLYSITGQYEEVIAGQLLDTLPAGELATVGEVMKIQLHKTAAYTTVGPLQIGARMAGANPELLDRLAAYGGALGLLFGITDDLLGMFADSGVTGKPSCTDLHENKQTILFLYAKQLCRGESLELLSSMLGKPHRADEDLSQLRNVLIQSGARAQTEKLAETYASQALAAIGPLSGPAAQALKSLPSELLHRAR